MICFEGELYNGKMTSFMVDKPLKSLYEFVLRPSSDKRSDIDIVVKFVG